ncbi:hypothetical protein Vi05172_g12860 [Venturia inaequalis]|nr:hypothetical protein Vi05172_g12860 [Venturia inaequalis]
MRTPASSEPGPPVLSSQINSPDATTSQVKRKRGRPSKADRPTPSAPVPSKASSQIPGSQIGPDATLPQTRRKRGRPRKEDTNKTSAPVPFEPGSTIPSSQINPDTTPTPIKKKRGRPKKKETTPPTKIPNSAAFPTSRTDPEANFTSTRKAPVTPPRFRCRLDVLYEQQRRRSGTDETSPRRARVVHLPSRRTSPEPADRAQKRSRYSSSATTTTSFSSSEGQSRSKTNDFEYDKNWAQGSQFTPASSVELGDHTGSLHLPDRYDSKEALIFCGLADDVSAAYSEEWRTCGKPGTLGSYALDRIKETATNRGFNPWACSEIVMENFWSRMRRLAITQEHHDILVENILPDGERKWKWERDWTTSLRDMGLAQSLIDTVGQSLYANMRENTPVSHWAYNFVKRKWNELTRHDHKINDTLAKRNFEAEKTRSEEEERQREEQELFDLQQWARENSDLPGAAEIEGRRIAEMVRPRSPSLFFDFDLSPTPFDHVQPDHSFQDVTGDEEEG